MKRIGKLLRPFPTDLPLAALHLADMPLGYAGDCGKFSLRHSLTMPCPAKSKPQWVITVGGKRLGNGETFRGIR